MSKHAPETSIDKSGLPAELTTRNNPIDIKAILASKDNDLIEFSYGCFIPGAHAFNNYLEANVQPGSTLKLTKSSTLKLIKQLALTLNSGGLESLAMVCLGEACVRYSDCPIVMSGQAPPISKNCPIERTEALNHVRSLSKDFGEGRSYADQIMIQGVAGVQMLKARVYADLAKNPDPIITVQKGTDNRGRKLEDRVENPNFKILQNLSKQEHTLLKGLHLTQEQRIKMSGSVNLTPDTMLAKLKDKLNKLKRDNKTTDLDLDIIDVDVELTKENDKEQANGQVTEVHSRNGQGSSGSYVPQERQSDTPAQDGEHTSQTDLDGIARDIRAGIGRVEKAKTDYRSAQRKRSDGSGKPYFRKSPFDGRSAKPQDTKPGPDASSMEEII